jgi:hypothetical protein
MRYVSLGAEVKFPTKKFVTFEASPNHAEELAQLNAMAYSTPIAAGLL